MPSKSLEGIERLLCQRRDKAMQRARVLSQYAGKHPASEIASIMGCTEVAVRRLAARNGISLRTCGKEWSEQEKQFVIKNAPFMTKVQMAKVLNRTEISIQSFCQYHKIRLAKTGQYHHSSRISDEDVEMCRKLHEEGVPVRDIAEKMEINRHLVHSIVYYRRT